MPKSEFKYKYKQNQKIQFKHVGAEDKFITGIILGVAHNELPVIGHSYIVKVTDGFIPNDSYPFDTTIAFECHIVPID